MKNATDPFLFVNLQAICRQLVQFRGLALRESQHKKGHDFFRMLPVCLARDANTIAN